MSRIIEKTKNVIIGSGDLDMILPTNGTLFAIQNMTWGGLQGLQEYPGTDLYVPYHPEYNGGSLAGAGILGSWGSERGLTFYRVQLSGHGKNRIKPLLTALMRHRTARLRCRSGIQNA
jgi:carboxypeptidase D